MPGAAAVAGVRADGTGADTRGPTGGCRDEGGSRLEQVLHAGRFAITAELAPPDSADPNDVLHRARALDGWVDAVNATDAAGANVHMSSLAVSVVLMQAGHHAVMQVSCRDRNRIAVQGDVLGAAALGVRAVLCLTGDGVQAGDHPGAKPVFDLDSISLLATLRRLRDEGRYLSGRALSGRPKLFLGAVENPFSAGIDTRVARLKQKLDAGAQFIQTQYCFDITRLREFMARARDCGLDRRAFILAGVGPLASPKSARWLRTRVPGIHIPDGIVRRLEQARAPRDEGRRICVELMQQISEIEGISGIHVMAFRQEEAIGELLQASGLRGARGSNALERT
jgi:methylenetetrahydrofolate reductase (NADPH)